MSADSSDTRATSPLTSVIGLGSGGLYKNINGALPRLEGTFNPSQRMARQQIDKGEKIEGLRQMPPIRPVPFMNNSAFLLGHPASPRHPRPTLKYVPIRLPSSANVNSDPGQCQRKDGKSWQYPGGAVDSSNDSERHKIHRSEKRKHLEGPTTGAAGVMPILGRLPWASYVNGDYCSNSGVAERETNFLHPAIPNSLAIQQKRMLAMQENPLSDSPSKALPNFLFSISSTPENIALAPSPNEMSQKSTGVPSTDIGGITTDYSNCATSSNLVIGELDLNRVPLDTSLGSTPAGELDLNLGPLDTSLGSTSAGELDLNQVPLDTSLDTASASAGDDEDALWDEFLISDTRNHPAFFSELPPYIMEWLAKEIKL